MKIKFNSDGNLPLNKPLSFNDYNYVFEKDGKLYPQVFLDDALYKLII